MPESKVLIGKFDIRVVFTPPPDKDEQRRIDALKAWLLDQWEAQPKEVEHADVAR